MEFKLANILLDNSNRFYNYKNLYCFSASPILDNQEIDGKTLLPYGTYDFATYFNSFSLKKWREYTSIDCVSIHLEIRGKCEVFFEGIAKKTIGISRECVGSEKLDSTEFSIVDFKYPLNEFDLLAFKIVTHESCDIRNCYYYTEISEEKIDHVDLVLATTTFKKEDYIKRNVKLFKEEVLNSIDPAFATVQMIVVDNAKTLDRAEIDGESVHLFQNQNVGGSGGFARGMIEAKRLERSATHVLIMDDDIELSPESIKRTLRLLCLVNDEYRDAFVSGAMFSLGNQAIQIEDVGQARSTGSFGAIKKHHDMNVFHQVLLNETEFLLRDNKYAAFWFCCIPMKTIQEKGLPLPLFIRYDDAEYGLRCKPKFMTMNGINVWHEDFDMRYSAFYEKYCAVRNALVIQSVSGICKEIDYFKTKVEKNFKRDIKKFNYDSAELILDGLEDYLKGPKFIEQNNCEQILKEKIKKNEKLVALQELGVTDINLEEIKKSKKRGKVERATDALTYNGQRFSLASNKGSSQGIILFDANAYPGKRVHNKTKILMVHPNGETGFTTEKNKERFRELLKRYRKLRKEYQSRSTALLAEYRAHRDYMYSEEFWKKYLEID